jgi:O-antigen/teichoic acid export membrane protein
MSSSSISSTTISRGFWSALTLKPVSALIGIGFLIALVRVSTTEAYAVYVAAWAMIEVVILLSNAGSLPAAYRYVHRTSLESAAPEGPVKEIVGLRVGSLLVALGVLYVALQPLALNPTIGPILTMFPVFAVIICAEGIARLHDVLLESCFCQARAQFSQIIRISFKFAPLLYFSHLGEVTVRDIFICELIGVCAGLIASSGLFYSLYWGGAGYSRGSASNEEIVKYAFPAYLTQAANVFYSIDALKLVLSKQSDPLVVAVFGFAHALAGLVQRYMPANVMSGFMRPLFIMASEIDDDMKSLNEYNNLWTKINLITVAVAILIFIMNSKEIIALFSERYLDSSIPIIIILISLMMASLRLCLATLCLAVQFAKPPLFSEVACIPSIILAIPASMYWGASGVASIVLFIELVWLAVCLSTLRQEPSVRLHIDWLGNAKMLALCGFFAVVGKISLVPLIGSIATTILVLGCFALAVWKTAAVSQSEQKLFRSFVFGRRGQ